MISIEIRPAAGGRDGYLRAEGHAETAGNGKDLICAAVSCLIGTLQANLELCWGVGVRSQKRAGFGDVRWFKTDRRGHGMHRANLAAGFAYNGLRALSEVYPGAVQVRWLPGGSDSRQELAAVHGKGNEDDDSRRD